MSNTKLLTSESHSQPFRLRDLIKSSLDLWVISWFLGLITAMSVVGLLMMSGWFLTATAFAGMVAVGSHSFNYMVPAAIIRMLAISRTAGRYGELMVSHNAIFSLLKDLRVKFFRMLAQEPLTSQHKTLQSAQQMHRLVNDINALNEFNLRVVMPWLQAIIMVSLMTGFILLYLPDSQLALSHIVSRALIAVLLAMTVIVPTVMAYKSMNHSRTHAKLSEQRRDALIAPLTIITQLIMWRQWQPQTKNFITHDENLQKLDSQADKHKYMAIMAVQWIIHGLMLVVLIVVALTAIPTDTLSVNSDLSHVANTIPNMPIILAMVLGLFGLQEVVLPLVTHYLSFGKATASKERLNEMLASREGAEEMPTSAPVTSESVTSESVTSASVALMALPTTDLTVQLHNLSAKLPNAIVGASDVTATVRSGVPMIISGASGCGKSTLLQTLAHELDVQSGKITLNDTSWQNYDWADQLGYLGQQLDIFDQTLADNLRLGQPTASDEELLAVLDMVSLGDWVQSQPQGLNTCLGEYGTAISGGQARRIALARLLLKPRKVMLLDEPFAGLDKESHSKVWQAVKSHQKDAILIVVSHHQTWDNMGEVDRLAL